MTRYLLDTNIVSDLVRNPQGGNGRNADPGAGVVDLECRVHGTSNVLVTDASTFTSCIRVNAQLTTMAMAHYATAQAPFGVI